MVDGTGRQEIRKLKINLNDLSMAFDGGDPEMCWYLDRTDLTESERADWTNVLTEWSGEIADEDIEAAFDAAIAALARGSDTRR